MPDLNPFIYGRALTPAEFLGRERELRRLFNRMATGQSTAVIGQPHVGKTSLLKYLLDENARQTLFGTQFEGDIFSFLDFHTLHSVKSQGDFWKHALAPLEKRLNRAPKEDLSGVADLYTTAGNNQFGAFVLGQLFTEMKSAGIRLVLLLDEFDGILAHPTFNSAEFYGSLRALASHSGGLVLVVAARYSLEQLNRLTQGINPHGSPYFNIFTDLHLGALSPNAINELLERTGERFTSNDSEYVQRVSGQHPFLAQAAAAMLWDSDEEGATGQQRYRAAARALYHQTRQHFADTWRVWSNATRKAVTAVALAQIPRLLSEHSFLVSELIDDLDDYSPELDALETNGTLAQKEEGDWEITQDAFLWWLADELRRNVRDDTGFEEWLRAQELENLLTSNERKKMSNAVRKVMELTGRGATTLIESLAKGFGEGCVKT